MYVTSNIYVFSHSHIQMEAPYNSEYSTASSLSNKIHLHFWTDEYKSDGMTEKQACEPDLQNHIRFYCEITQNKDQ